MFRTFVACSVIAVAVCGLAAGAIAAEALPTKSVAGLAVSPEEDWPQWRGPRRDGICNETGLLKAWPAAGPKVLWTATRLGKGWSSPIIGGGLLYITGDVGNDVWISAYRLDGTLAWKVRNGQAWLGSYQGARACCALSEGKLYHMNAHGRVVCLDAATGKSVWAVETFKRFDAKKTRWGHSECLLVDGSRLIVSPGGRKAAMAALDKATGATVWASEPIGNDNASYASPILFEYGGLRHLVNFSSTHAFGVNADTGKILWTTPRTTRYQVIASQAVYRDGTVFLTSCDRSADPKTAVPVGEQFRLTVTGSSVKIAQVWTSKLNTLSGGVVQVDGRLYGAGYKNRDGWLCLDAKTGKTLYSKGDLDSGALLYADGLLYCLSEGGEMALLKPTDTAFETKGRFTLVSVGLVTKRVRDAWAHPVIHAGRLYLRYHGTLWCFDIAAK